MKYPFVFCLHNNIESLLLHFWDTISNYICPIEVQVLELTKFTHVYSRWRDLAETSGEAIAHDNQSLDSGAEGPEEPERPEQLSSPSGMSV